MKPFWNGFLLSLSLCLDLGMVNVAVLEISVTQGGMAGFLLGAGSCIGDMFYFTLAVMGAALLLEWAPICWSLWIFGTGVLLLLAWRMTSDAIRPKELSFKKTQVLSRRAGTKLLFTGIGMALASPTAILWFAAVGGSVIASFGGHRSSSGPFVAGFAAAGLAWSGLFAYAAAKLRLLGHTFIRAFSLVSALLFLYFAGIVFINGLQTLF
jgi:L-lysine exporter family protein LysE/ArgO